ncbi:hypothetical protein BOX30_04280 [Leptospirillum ferriphilum]|nr:hypothetical protein BOX30_04280 [Leptospirillum ferriphilum]
MGYVRELSGMVVHDEFRGGNTSPSSGHVAFLEACFRRLPEGLRFTRLRTDSASYQATVITTCQKKGIRFCIGADLDSAVQEDSRERLAVR